MFFFHKADILPPLGLINVHKHAGATSRRIVDHVQRLVRPAKVGHAGTLDPLATGVLVVCVGGATRLIEYVQAQTKGYEARFLLGRHSPTEDIEGEVTLLTDPGQPTVEEINGALPAFLGNIMQMPPQYSALKVQGKRAYDLARAGITAELKPREIAIHSLRLTRYEYPELELTIECGSGTYIRSLGRDLARSLGTEAVMSALVRTHIGPFTLDGASPIESITSESVAGLLLPPRHAVAELPSLMLTEPELLKMRNGQRIEHATGDWSIGERVAILNDREELVGLVSVERVGVLKPEMNLPQTAG